jgi:hypothetical protein
MTATTTDYSQTFKVGAVKFTPATEGTTCQIKPSGYFHTAPCGKPAVTVPGQNAGYRYANKRCCKQHAGVAKRVATNDETRRQEYEAKQRRYAAKANRDAAAKARIEAHGIDLSGHNFGGPTWTDIANWLDRVKES